MVWTLPPNLELIRRYITSDPKIVVLTRPVDEVVESYANAHYRAGLDCDVDLLRAEGEPIMRSANGAQWAREMNAGEFLFVEYADFMADPAATLERVYDHYGLPGFDHNFDNIVCRHQEDESVHGVPGLHTVRSELGLRPLCSSTTLALTGRTRCVPGTTTVPKGSASIEIVDTLTGD
jgi:hypothetical protein